MRVGVGVKVVFNIPEAEKLYAYATKDGDILIETITDMKTGLWRKLYRCFPMSYEKMKKHYHPVEIEIKMIGFIADINTDIIEQKEA